MCLYDYNSNIIDGEPIKYREDDDLITGYKQLYSRLKKGGIAPLLRKLDNKASEQLREAIKQKRCKYQLAPPYDHR